MKKIFLIFLIFFKYTLEYDIDIINEINYNICYFDISLSKCNLIDCIHKYARFSDYYIEKGYVKTTILIIHYEEKCLIKNLLR